VQHQGHLHIRLSGPNKLIDAVTGSKTAFFAEGLVGSRTNITTRRQRGLGTGTLRFIARNISPAWSGLDTMTSMPYSCPRYQPFEMASFVKWRATTSSFPTLCIRLIRRLHHKVLSRNGTRIRAEPCLTQAHAEPYRLGSSRPCMSARLISPR
jgi:hypothetical protein